jgi:hypothetical protein
MILCFLLVRCQHMNLQSLHSQWFSVKGWGCKLIDRTLLHTGRFQKEKQKVNEKSPLCSRQSTVCGLGAQSTINRATCSFTFLWQFREGTLMYFLICPLLWPLQKLEDRWACISQPHVDLCVATFQIWYSSLKCSGLCILKFLPPKGCFSCNLSFQVIIHLPYLGEFRVGRQNCNFNKMSPSFTHF